MPDEAAVLATLRKICLALPEVVETVTFGHPTFRAGKRPFAVLETYGGELSLALGVGQDRQEVLLEDTCIYRTPYVGHRGWVSLRVGGTIDWGLVRDLVDASYRRVALGRMLKTLDREKPSDLAPSQGR